MIGYDVMSLGNHEFDDGVAGLAPFVEGVQTPIVACNADFSKEPALQKIVKSVVLERGGQRIGVIGYITPDTTFLAAPGDTVSFNDEIECLRTEADRLVAVGVKMIIALGHSGFEVDKKIARALPQVDIVVGGHSNTFLFTENATHLKPSEETPLGDYPIVIEHESGGKTLVVQAFAYGKYLGKLDVEFDEDGNLKSYDGEPILLDSSVSEGKHSHAA